MKNITDQERILSKSLERVICNVQNGVLTASGGDREVLKQSVVICSSNMKRGRKMAYRIQVTNNIWVDVDDFNATVVSLHATKGKKGIPVQREKIHGYYNSAVPEKAVEAAVRIAAGNKAEGKILAPSEYAETLKEIVDALQIKIEKQFKEQGVQINADQFKEEG